MFIEIEKPTFYQQHFLFKSVLEIVDVTFKSNQYIRFQDDLKVSVWGKEYLVASWHIKPNVNDFAVTLRLYPTGADQFVGSNQSTAALAATLNKKLVSPDFDLDTNGLAGMKVHEFLIVNRSMYFTEENRLPVFFLSQSKLYSRFVSYASLINVDYSSGKQPLFNIVDIYDCENMNKILVGQKHVYGQNPLATKEYTPPLVDENSIYPSPGFNETCYFDEYNVFDNIITIFSMDDLEPFQSYNFSFAEPFNIYNGVYFLINKRVNLENGLLKKTYDIGKLRNGLWVS